MIVGHLSRLMGWGVITTCARFWIPYNAEVSKMCKFLRRQPWGWKEDGGSGTGPEIHLVNQRGLKQRLHALNLAAGTPAGWILASGLVKDIELTIQDVSAVLLYESFWCIQQIENKTCQISLDGWTPSGCPISSSYLHSRILLAQPSPSASCQHMLRLILSCCIVVVV